MGFEQRLIQKSTLELNLEQKLELHFNSFERELWDVAEFQDIDIERF